MKTRALLMIALVSVPLSAAFAHKPIVYPARGQSQQ
jgi:hypothetical protein